ncbi:hypothetical protein [Cytobacillus firmus]|uniref:hypothetical protein n=1 Tax=Cytobacillus firmus TaxID=1399 RepID=UPI002162749A|nr:hypothetical protein [Cytobacillus firmus]MCS0673348.1 hypothetical protein [Cytobacillus firmus]
MYIIASFDYSASLEVALTELMENDISQSDILALPLDKLTEAPRLFDSIHYADGTSLVDMAGILGCIFMLLGSIYGFILEWGPIIWALIGLAIGLVSGFLIKWLFLKTKYKRSFSKSKTEVFLIVYTKEMTKVQKIKEILWQHNAHGLTVYSCH